MSEHVGSGRAPGLLVYLHGHASSPDRVHSRFREHHDDGWCRVCPTAPLRVEGGFAWFEQGPRGVDAASLAAATRQVASVVRGTAAELGIALSETVLGGFSQGAAVAVAVAAALDEPLGGLVLQAGFVPEVFGEDFPVDSIRAARVLVQHPSEDEVVPVAMASDLAEMLKGAPGVGSVDLEVVDGGHTASDEMVAAALRWLDRA